MALTIEVLYGSVLIDSVGLVMLVRLCRSSLFLCS